MLQQAMLFALASHVGFWQYKGVTLLLLALLLQQTLQLEVRKWQHIA